MKKKLLIEVGDDIDLDFLRKNCKTGGLIANPVPECRAIADGKALSDMTIGDVLTTMFPNLREIKMVLENEDGDDFEISFDITVGDGLNWNAPYKGSERCCSNFLLKCM